MEIYFRSLTFPLLYLHVWKEFYCQTNLKNASNVNDLETNYCENKVNCLDSLILWYYL